MPTIELDCPPGWPRPGDLIEVVLKDTGLTAQKDRHDDTPGAAKIISTLFGNWLWEFPDVAEDDWKNRVRPIIQPRIEALYNNGIIRYASW